MADAKLVIEIKNKKPVELGDLTRSFLSLAEEFKRFIDVNEPEAAAGEVKLYVNEIRTGSIIADLVAISPQIIQGVSYVNAIVGFNSHLKKAYDYLSGKTDEKPELDKTSYQNLSNIIEPIAKDHGSQFNVGTVYGNVYFTVNSTDANAAQNTARKEIEALREPTASLHEKVVLYWYQARADAASRTGDKGIIESISAQPVKVICIDDTTKARMILDEKNPFKEAYVVDVMVETIKGKPALYKILVVHDKLERDTI